MSQKRIGIIGAGLTGLTLADILHKKADVTLFDKSRGVSGRLSTRYAGDYEFDHGAQAIQASHPQFITFMESLSEQGVAAKWKDGYIGVPKMNAIGKHLAKPFNINLGTHINTVEKHDEGWHFTDSEGESAGIFDIVICTAPPEQNCLIMPNEFPHKADIKKRKLRGCYALMLGFETPPTLKDAEYNDYIIKSIVKNHEKPSRETGYSLMILSQYDWAESHMEKPNDKVQSLMLKAASTLCDVDLSTAEHQALHRWRYANVRDEGSIAGFIAPELGLAACGDWCLKGDAQSAYLSALYTSEKLEILL